MAAEHAEDIPDLHSLAQPVSRMAAILTRYHADLRTLERKYPLPMSKMCRGRKRRFLCAWLDAIQAIDFTGMNREERIDFTLFKNHLNFCVRKLDQRTAHDDEVAPLLPFAPDVVQLEEARRRMDWAEPAASAEALNKIASSIKAAHLALAEPKNEDNKTAWKRTVANRAAESIACLQAMLNDWFSFYNGFDPMFTWWADSPYRAVDEALALYREYITNTLVKSDVTDSADIVGDPIGSEALTAELAFEMIPYTPQELIEIARVELLWCESELARASGELGFGTDTRAALEHVKTLHEAPGGQPELVKKLALEAIDYLRKHNLVTVPALAEETWRLEMMSPEKQKVNPFFLGGEVIQVSFPTNTMTHDEKQMSMRGNNAHFSRSTVQHELIPGHHLQGFMLERYRTHRSPFHTPFWIEGWTIYWEFLLYKMGFACTPENQIGMLFWRIHRCVRVIFSLSFHLETMTPQECIEMLVERVGHERANATAEVRRSCGDTYPPLYQCAYLIGGLQMWALRREVVDTGVMTERDFHDAVIRENCIPIEMIRADLMGHEITTDFVSNWRFYVDPASA